MTPEHKGPSGIPNGNGTNAITRWWPVILFVIVQLFTTGVMYERLVQLESSVQRMVPRSEWDIVNAAREREMESIERSQQALEQQFHNIVERRVK